MSVDPDFTEELIVPSFSDEQRSVLEKEGLVEIVWGHKYVFRASVALEKTIVSCSANIRCFFCEGRIRSQRNSSKMPKLI